MICQLCKNQRATLHITEIDRQERRELHICQECARLKGLAENPFMPLTELLGEPDVGKKRSPKAQPTDIRCPSCGIGLEDIRKGGRFGCDQDLDVFDPWLETALEQRHGEVQHVGKIPRNAAEGRKREAEICRLKRALEKAVRSEDFEAAARLRDQIRSKEAGRDT